MKHNFRSATSTLLAGLLFATASIASAQPPANDKQVAPEGALLPRDSAEAAIFRGGLVFASYCVTCHGINADGNGRSARLYNPRPANLRTTDKNDDYIRLIVKMGGEPIGRSKFMPPWGAELTDEQMTDVVAYIRSINANPQTDEKAPTR